MKDQGLAVFTLNGFQISLLSIMQYIRNSLICLLILSSKASEAHLLLSSRCCLYLVSETMLLWTKSSAQSRSISSQVRTDT